jgi:hypothetical protein
MIDERIKELIQGAIDGTLSRDDSAALDQYLAAHPEAQAHLDEMTQLAETLAAVDVLPAPAELKPAILRALEAHEGSLRTAELVQGDIGERLVVESAGTPPRGLRPPSDRPQSVWQPRAQPAAAGWLAVLLHAAKARPAWRYAFAFAAGIAIGIIALAIYTDGFRAVSPDRDTTAISGAMLPDAALAGFATADEASFDVAGARGHLLVGYRDGVARLTIAVESRDEIEIVVDFDGTAFSPRGFEGRRAPPGTVALDDEQLRLKHAGENTYLLFLAEQRQDATDLEVSVFAEGLIYQTDLRVRPYAQREDGASDSE